MSVEIKIEIDITGNISKLKRQKLWNCYYIEHQMFPVFCTIIVFLILLNWRKFSINFLMSRKTLDLGPMQVDCFSVFLSDLACFWLLVGFPPALWASHSSGLNCYDILLLFPSVSYSCRNSYSCLSMNLMH